MIQLLPPSEIVWHFSKDATKAHKENPKKIFYKKDIYTIHTEDGDRVLTLEENLSRIEYKFSKLRQEKIQQHKILSSMERLYLFMFICAMLSRTPTFEKEQVDQWGEIYDWALQFQNAFDEASPQKKESMINALGKMPDDNKSKGMSLVDIKETIKNPIQKFLPLYVTKIASMMMQMPFFILETDDSNIFITSDNPCVWYDPSVYKNPRPFGAGGLISETIEISIPLSPYQLLFLGNKITVSGQYMFISDHKIINNFNYRTRMNSNYFISNSSKIHPGWFMFGT